MIDDRAGHSFDDPVTPARTARDAKPAPGIAALLWSTWPIVAAFGSAIGKVSVFNLQPDSRNAADWFAWSMPEAIGAVVSSGAVLTLLFAPLLFLPRRAGSIAAWALNGFLSLLVWADLLHVRYFSDIAPLTAVSVAWQAPLIWRSVWALVRLRDVVLGLDVCVAFIVYVWSRRKQSSNDAGTWRYRRLLGGSLVALGIAGLAVPVVIIRRDTDQVFRWDFFRFFGVRRVGWPAYRAYEVSRAIERRQVVQRTGDPAHIARVERFLDARARVSAQPHSLIGAARGANLIMVMVESLNAYPVQMVVGGQPVMPNLDAFSKRSINFEEFYGQTWYGKTTDAEFIALNALHPLSDGSVQARYARNGFRALPEILAARGYDAFSAHPFYAAMYRRAEMHPRWGFARSYFGEDYPTADPIGMGMGDAEFFTQTVPRMTASSRPFMSLLITLTSHYPFHMAPQYQALPLGEFQGTMVGDYLQSMHYVDAALGSLLEQLARAGLLETSVVAIMGDHREQALESDTLSRMLDAFGGVRLKQDGFDLQRWREQQRLPFVIDLPRDQAAGRRYGSGGHIDIAPTLLGLLGIDDREMVSLGRDLLREPSGLVVMRDASFVVGDTACVAPGEYVPRRTCGVLSTGAPLDTMRFKASLEEARARLDISDVIVRGDLVQTLAKARGSARQTP